MAKTLVMKTLYATPERVVQAGQKARFDDAEAAHLLRTRQAVEADDDPAERARAKAKAAADARASKKPQADRQITAPSGDRQTTPQSDRQPAKKTAKKAAKSAAKKTTKKTTKKA